MLILLIRTGLFIEESMLFKLYNRVLICIKFELLSEEAASSIPGGRPIFPYAGGT